MRTVPETSAYLRREDAPLLPPPVSMSGIQGWVLANLFPTIGNAIVSIIAGAFLLWLGWGVLDWAIFSAVWSGDNREVCAVEGAGACWPFVQSRFAQWIYGFYPIDQRWRVNICFFVGAVALVPMLIPSVPYKKWNALFLLIVYPLITLILLTGGHFSMSGAAFLNAFSILALAAAFLPLLAFGIEEGIQSNRFGLALAGLGVLIWLSSFAIDFGALNTDSQSARVVSRSNHPSPGTATIPLPTVGTWGTSFRASPAVTVYGANPISSAYPPLVRLK